MTIISSPATDHEGDYIYDEQEEVEELQEPGSAHGDSIQLRQELKTAIERDKMDESNEREETAADGSHDGNDYLGGHVILLEDHISQLVDHVLDTREKIELLHQVLTARNVPNYREDIRQHQYPVLSHLASTALDGNERNLLRSDLDKVTIQVAISVCADAELSRLLCKFDIEVPAQSCLTFLDYQQEVAAVADDMENRAQSIGVDDEHEDGQAPNEPGTSKHLLHLLQLQDALPSGSDGHFLIPQLLCLDFSRSAIVPSFFGFSPCSPSADAYYSMWLARNVIFGSRMSYRSQIYFQRSDEAT